jgi:hypothetical protein
VSDPGRDLDTIERLIDHLRLRDLVLVGWWPSVARTATHLLRRGPGTLAAVVLIDRTLRFRASAGTGDGVGADELSGLTALAYARDAIAIAAARPALFVVGDRAASALALWAAEGATHASVARIGGSPDLRPADEQFHAALDRLVASLPWTG